MPRFTRALPALAAAYVLCSNLLPGASFAAKIDPTPPEKITVGASESFALTPDLTERQNGTWQHSITRKDATFIKVHFSEMNLRPGDRIVLQSATGRLIEELTGRGPKGAASFWSLSAFGDTLELTFEFARPYSETPFAIDRLLVGNSDLFEPGESSPPNFSRNGTEDLFGPESICLPADFEDVICYDDDFQKWANVQASVGVMSVGGNPNSAIFCSGSNVSPENYVLTNDHCLSTQNDCESTEFVFRFYRTDCGNGAPPTEDWVSYRCDEVVAQSPFINCDAGLNDLDFTLSKVQGDPSALFGSVTADPEPLTSGEAIYIVQHPSGRPHEITHGQGQDVVVDGTVLRYYDTLDTEGGSSGSPIFREADGKLIGLHHCGGCEDDGVGNRGMMMSDIYPMIEEFVCALELDLASDGFEDLAEVEGNGDLFVDPGEIWQLAPRVRNRACELEAVEVTAKVAVNPDSAMPVTLLDTDVEFGNLAGGQVATALSPIRFEIGETAECGGQVILSLLDIQANNGGPYGSDPQMATVDLGSELLSTVLKQNFSRQDSGWEIVHDGSGSGTASTWTRSNPAGRSFAFSEPFAIVDSDFLGQGQTMDESMISPPTAVPAFDELVLQFRHDFRHYDQGLDEQADVDVRSSATGGNWVNILNFSGGSDSGTVRIDVTDLAQGQQDFQVRFRYWNAEYEWWWAVDDVFLYGSFGTVCNLSAPALSYAGSCPGDATFSIEGATPFTNVAMTRGAPGGTFIFEQGECAGLELELDNPDAMGNLLTDGNGSASFQITLPADVCGSAVQAVDTASCRTSEAAELN